MKEKSRQNFTESETFEKQISTNKSHVYGWGNDKFGQLGLGVYSYSSNYTAPRFFKYSVNITRISCGFDHALLLSETGIVYGMGSNKYGQLGLVK